MHIPKRILFTVLFVSFVAPVHVISRMNDASYDQEFVITAYYSPEPGQCCYVTGGLDADKILNGEGVMAADGTSVYPGMLAAPSSYAYGTRISLPGIGVLTVHDRGGAINELNDGSHRLDIWAGYGEEGLARALAFGVQRIRGKVYPVGSRQPPLSMALETLPSILQRLLPFNLYGDNLLALTPKREDRSLSTQILQKYLKNAGYFRHSATGYYGEQTEAALQALLRDYHVEAPSDQLTKEAAAFIVAAVRRMEARDPISSFVDAGSAPATVQEAQRILRYLGYYRGRTDGVYDEDVQQAILAFQQTHSLVGTAEDPGAGRIGPITSRTLFAEWNKKLVKRIARTLQDKFRIEELLAKSGELPNRFLSEGYSGAQVLRLQHVLANRGFFPREKANGVFGSLTKQSVLAYQLEYGLVDSASDTGAGTVGPATLSLLWAQERVEKYRMVRAEGWNVL